MKKFILSLLFFIPLSGLAQTHYSAEEIDRVYRWVAADMGVELRSDIPMPGVFASEDIEDGKYAEHCPYCENKRINWYVSSHNEIWILRGKDTGVLAHEMAHFFQIKYFGVEDDNEGSYEEEANRIQDRWRRSTIALTS